MWKAFAADEYIQQNSGIISIELANEPVRVHLSDGSNSDKALRDYFQPVVDVIRQQGFKGIIWVPGAGYQSQYQNYAKYPVKDSEDNFSYAVHVYSGGAGLPYRLQIAVVLIAYADVARTDSRWTNDDIKPMSNGILN